MSSKTPEIILSGNAMKRMLKNGFETFKKLCEQIAPLVDAKDSYGIKVLLGQMNSSILDIQKGINKQLELMDVPETHIATRIISLLASEREEKDSNKQYYNMAFITVVGKVMEAPKEFTTKSGVKMFSFRVVEIDCSADKEYKNVFEVVSRMDDYLFGHLVKDSGVTVTGSFSTYQRKTDDKTFLTLKISSPSISLH